MELEIAGSHRQRLRGLIGRAPASGRALLLPRTRSIHTFGMRAPLDLVWLGPGGEVMRTDRAVRPWRLRMCLRARAVIECRSGDAEHVLARLYSEPLIALATSASRV